MMSTINSHTFRSNNRKFIRSYISLDRPPAQQKSQVTFRSSQSDLRLISTSEGSIVDDTIVLPQHVSNFSTVIEPLRTIGALECFISYLDNDTLVRSETLMATFVDEKQVDEDSRVPIDVIQSAGRDYESRMNNFFDLLDKKRAPWRTFMDMQDDCNLYIKDVVQSRKYFCIGELSRQLLHTDIIFTVEPALRTIAIPVELFWKYYDSYSTNAELGCFELVQPDFQNIPNLYFKCLISNTFTIDRIPRRTSRQLSAFRSPLGEYFNPVLWHVNTRFMMPELLNV